MNPTNTLELLLRPETPNIQKQMPTADFVVSRLSAAVGQPVIFSLRALPYGRVQELSDLAEDAEIHILLAGCVFPDLKDTALREKFGGETPVEMCKAMLLPGEIADLSRAVERLCGYRQLTIQEIKNA